MKNELLDRCLRIAAHPNVSAEDRQTAVRCAYDLGVAEGRVEGVNSTGEGMLKAMDKFIASKAPK